VQPYVYFRKSIYLFLLKVSQFHVFLKSNIICGFRRVRRVVLLFRLLCLFPTDHLLLSLPFSFTAFLLSSFSTKCCRHCLRLGVQLSGFSESEPKSSQWLRTAVHPPRRKMAVLQQLFSSLEMRSSR